MIAVEKTAGKDPCELAANTLSKTSKIAASTSTLPGTGFAGRLKVPNDNASCVLAEIDAAKTISTTERVAELTLVRDDEIMLLNP